MKIYWRSIFGILVAGILFWSTSVAAADFCSDMSTSNETTTPRQPQSRTNRDNLVKAEANIPSAAQIVFIGDSLIQKWPATSMNRLFPGQAIWNYGVGSDRTQQVLWRLRSRAQILERYSPEIVYVLAGTNNLGKSSGCEIAEGIAAIATRIHELWPAAQIRMLELLPRGPDFAEYVKEREEVSQYLRTFALGIPWIRLVDLNDATLACHIEPSPASYSQPKEEWPDCVNYFEDHLHLTPEGYDVLTDLLLAWSEDPQNQTQ